MDDQVVVNQANQASQVPVVAPVQPAPTGAEAHVAVVSPTPVIPVLEKKSKKKLFEPKPNQNRSARRPIRERERVKTQCEYAYKFLKILPRISREQNSGFS